MQAIDESLNALLRTPLHAVSAGGALGYVGLDIPPDLLLAAARGSAHLPWRVTQDTPRADAWLESSFPPWARSMLEDWALGRFDCFAEVVFTRGEDVSQRLYYYVCELQRRGKLSGPTPLIFDIARIDRPSSHRYTAEALRRLARRLQLTDESLRAGIQRANALREAFSGLRRARRAPGSLYEKLVRASLFGDVGPVVAALGRQAPASGRRRVVLAGSSPPDERIHELIEARGWQVAAEFCDRNLDRLGGVVENCDADPVQAIAQSWLRHTFLARDLAIPGERLQALLRETQADAAVLWLTREDEALAGQRPRLRRALAYAGIPFVALSAADWNFADGAAQDIQAFLDGLHQ